MSEHYQALLRLYAEYKCASEQINRYIKEKYYHPIEEIVKRKDVLLKHILNQENIVEFNDDMRLEQAAIKNEIAQLEQENINLLNLARDEVKSELARVNKKTNLQKAYSMPRFDTGSIVNISE